ncbi:hypothetical protein [Granulosicoccus antarcticus]|uniref:hypothetical protein n=1 Tax=Granulosicoccus antarcticus TaxID=437505 RepID=UPI0012FD647A|nr:hypothetical protein [Granulosicoccus antarcticus]
MTMICLVASAAVLAFVVLRRGESAVLQVAGGCLVLLIVVSMVLNQSTNLIPLVPTLLWLPAILATILAAMVLARNAGLDKAILSIGLCCVFVVVGLTMITGDSAEFWKSQYGSSGAAALEQGESSKVLGAVVMEQGESSAALSAEQKEALIDVVAQMLTGVLGESIFCIALGALFFARSWQARLFNPGGFQKEFHELSLGFNAALIGVLVVLMCFFASGSLASAIAMIVIYVFFVQGLAVTHALVKLRGMHRYWLHGIYVLLLLPQTLLLLAALGLADCLFGLRRTKNV